MAIGIVLSRDKSSDHIADLLLLISSNLQHILLLTSLSPPHLVTWCSQGSGPEKELAKESDDYVSSSG
jgi:hypothetical protein